MTDKGICYRGAAVTEGKKCMCIYILTKWSEITILYSNIRNVIKHSRTHFIPVKSFNLAVNTNQLNSRASYLFGCLPIRHHTVYMCNTWYHTVYLFRKRYHTTKTFFIWDFILNITLHTCFIINIILHTCELYKTWY